MAYQRNMSRGESIRLFYSPDRPLVDSVMTLNANVMDPSGEPLRAGTVTVNARSPSGKTSTVQLPAAGEDSWGLMTPRKATLLRVLAIFGVASML